MVFNQPIRKNTELDTNYRKFKQIKIHISSQISGYIVYVFPDTAVQTCVKETVGFETFCKVFSILILFSAESISIQRRTILSKLIKK